MNFDQTYNFVIYQQHQKLLYIIAEFLKRTHCFNKYTLRQISLKNHFLIATSLSLSNLLIRSGEYETQRCFL